MSQRTPARVPELQLFRGKRQLNHANRAVRARLKWTLVPAPVASLFCLAPSPPRSATAQRAWAVRFFLSSPKAAWVRASCSRVHWRGTLLRFGFWGYETSPSFFAGIASEMGAALLNATRVTRCPWCHRAGLCGTHTLLGLLGGGYKYI